jgi:SNF family Na+-dependent transporter
MLVVYMCIAKGVKISGKIAIYSSSAPFILLFILLIRGLFLEGGLTGLYYLFIPDFSKLFKL